MFFSSEYVFPVGRTKPANRVNLRKSKLVGQVNLIEREVPKKFVVAHPATVRVQSNPGISCSPDRPPSRTASLPRAPAHSKCRWQYNARTDCTRESRVSFPARIYRRDRRNHRTGRHKCKNLFGPKNKLSQIRR